MRETILTRADVRGADLGAADLRDATGLVADQLAATFDDAETTLTDELATDHLGRSKAHRLRGVEVRPPAHHRRGRRTDASQRCTLPEFAARPTTSDSGAAVARGGVRHPYRDIGDP